MISQPCAPALLDDLDLDVIESLIDEVFGFVGGALGGKGGGFTEFVGLGGILLLPSLLDIEVLFGGGGLLGELEVI